MKRLLLAILSLLAALTACTQHYDFWARRITVDDGLPSNVVSRIWQDAEGYMWFDTRNGVCRYDGYEVMATTLKGNGRQPDPLTTSDATWMREGQGRLARHGSDGTVRSWQLIPRDIITYTRNDHFHVADVDAQTEAISTYGGGLYLHDKPSGRLTQLTRENSPGLIGNNYLTGLFVDRTGCIWTIEDYLGVRCLIMNRLRYRLLWPEPHATIQDANHVRCIAPIAGGRLVVSTQTGRVWTYDTRSGSFSDHAASQYRVYTALRDSDGRLWMGTRGRGLWCDDQPVSGLPSPHVFSVRQDGSALLVAMLEGGVARLAPGRSHELWLTGRNVHDAIRYDHRVWVAAEEGLYVLDSRGQPADSLRGSFSCLHIAANSTLWAGSTDSGLAKVSLRDGHIEHTSYHQGNGLASNVVMSVTSDRHGRLWVGTEKGLSCLDPATGDIASHQLGDGGLSDVFCERAALTLDNGLLLFGTHQGILEIAPAADHHTPPPATTVTTLLAGGEAVADASRLSYRQNSLTFHFSNFQYARARSVRYRYRLDGWDEDWSMPTSEHSAVYRHLPPGRYTFRVASAAGGPWGSEAAVSLRIGQPWWNSGWAWAAYLTTAAIVAVIALLTARRILRLHRTIDVERRVAAFKQDFYDRIERELRNPVNVLQGAAENVQLSGTSKTTVQSLRRGSRRMLKLMDMIRQFRQLDQVEIQLKAEQNDMNAEAEQRFRDISQAIHAEETELKELPPPPINRQTILIIEEDEDNLTHLTDTLNPYFRVTGCRDRSGGLTAIAEAMPSLVLLDITPHEKEGLELTRALGQKWPALPVIHLSSYDGDDRQLRSLRAGAADYIVKPFSGRVLIERIRRCLTTAVSPPGPPAAEVTSLPAAAAQPEVLTSVRDKRFLDQFQAVLASHVSAPDFSVEQFAALMGLGRTQFYKRVKALTGETPVAHLQRARLDYAARLLCESRMTAEEVMLRAGYHNASHFYAQFKRQFGMSPSQYRAYDH